MDSKQGKARQRAQPTRADHNIEDFNSANQGDDDDDDKDDISKDDDER